MAKKASVTMLICIVFTLQNICLAENKIKLYTQNDSSFKIILEDLIKFDKYEIEPNQLKEIDFVQVPPKEEEPIEPENNTSEKFETKSDEIQKFRLSYIDENHETCIKECQTFAFVTNSLLQVFMTNTGIEAIISSFDNQGE